MYENMVHTVDLFIHFQLCRPSRYMCSSSVIEVFRKQLLKDSTDSPKSEDKSLVTKKTRVAYSLKHYEAINNYLDSKPYLKKLKSKIPTHYMVRTFGRHNSLYVVDKEVARKIFEKIKPHIGAQKGHIVEVNAGLGVLTEYLMKANLPRLRIYEGESSLYRDLYVRTLGHHGEIRIFNSNLLMLPTISYLDKSDNGNRVSTLFQDISPLPWEDDPVMNIIVPIPADTFICYIVDCIIFQSGVCNYGRPDLIAIMPSTIYIKLMAMPSAGFLLYRYKSVLIQIIFECSLLLKVPDKAFLPWLKKRKSIIKDSYQPSKSDEDCMFVVKMTARKDLFQHVPPDQLPALWYFVRMMMMKRKANFIANMEKLIPGCGIRLIAHGLTIFTKCGSLTPEKYLDIFKEFITWPEFKASSFTTEMNRYFSRKHQSGLAEEIMVESMTDAKKRLKCYNLKGVEEEEDDSESDTEVLEEDKEKK